MPKSEKSFFFISNKYGTCQSSKIKRNKTEEKKCFIKKRKIRKLKKQKLEVWKFFGRNVKCLI